MAKRRAAGMAGLSYGARPLFTFKPVLLACRGGRTHMPGRAAKA